MNSYGDGIRILDLEDELKAKENLLATANAKIDELQKHGGYAQGEKRIEI